MKLHLQKLEATSLEMNHILQQWNPNTIMYVNESIQTKRETQKTQKNQTCLQRKKRKSAPSNDLIAFVNKRVVEKSAATEVSQLLRGIKEYTLLKVKNKI